MPDRAPVLFELTDFESEGGLAYVASCPSDMPSGDDMQLPHRSQLILLEDRAALGPAHSQHADIRAHGGGAYSHWGRCVYFSTSDNRDPRSNGRRYRGLWISARASHAAEKAHGVLDSLPAEYRPSEAYAAVEQILAILYPSARMGEDSKLFWQDKEALRDYRRLTGANMRSFERKLTVYSLVRALGHVDGELAECGVFEGATTFFMAKADQEAGRARDIHLFDSFEGLSLPGQYDGDYWARGSLAATEAKVLQNLKGIERIHTYRGWIPERFSEVADLRFAFVHIDVDLHDPTRDALEFFYSRTSPMGIILCDDSGFATCPGATRAMTGFFADKPERIISLPTGQDFIIRR